MFTVLNPLRCSMLKTFAFITLATYAGRVTPSLGAEPIGEPRVYKTVGGQDLKLYVVKPAGWKAEDKRAASVFFHGGGWVGGDPAQFDELSRYLSGRGMVCVQVRYRLLDKNGKEPPLVCVQDAKSAVRWVRSHAKELGIDPGRIAAGGGSAGGHLAAFVGMVDGLDDPVDDLKVAARANALILFNPVFDNGPDGGYGFDRVGGRYREFSPAHNVTRDDPPAIVFLGTNDDLIPVSVVEHFKANMTKARVRCVTVYAEGQPHGFFNREPWRTKTLRDTDEFLCALGWLARPTAGPGRTNSLEVGKVWAGTWTFRDPGFAGKVAQYSISVTERRGNTFRGKGSFNLEGVEMKTTLSGNVQGNRIEYREAGDGAFHFQVRGELRGDTIVFEFGGTGSQGNERFGTGEMIRK